VTTAVITTVTSIVDQFGGHCYTTLPTGRTKRYTQSTRLSVGLSRTYDLLDI